MRELSLHVLDLLQNSLEAEATEIALDVDEDREADHLEIVVTDNGRGMAPDLVREATDPFVTSRTTRRVGLGLPMLAAAASLCDGDLRVESTLGRGTSVTARFRLSHIDRAPLGDMTSTILSVLLREPPVVLRYRHRVGDSVFKFDSADVASELEDVPLSHPKVRHWLRELLTEGFAGLYRGDGNAEGTNDGGVASA
ncbi:MAG: ATP-binding protein [Dehalococcoidales bacterium]|nr:ATP-binding protein [Dehalococcoidales bacterium]